MHSDQTYYGHAGYSKDGGMHWPNISNGIGPMLAGIGPMLAGIGPISAMGVGPMLADIGPISAMGLAQCWLALTQYQQWGLA